MVSYSRHSPAQIESAIDRVIAAFAQHRIAFEWKAFEHDEPHDLVARLARRGFAIGDAEQLMILPVAAAEAVLEHRSSHRVERVTDAAGLVDYLAVAEAVWSERPGYSDWLELELRDRPEEISLHVAYVDDEPVAAARASYPRGSQFAGLWGGATLAAHRGKGLYRALVNARALVAAQRGFTYLMVDALETSRPTLARFGFERLSASRPCLWSPAGARHGGT